MDDIAIDTIINKLDVVACVEQIKLYNQTYSELLKTIDVSRELPKINNSFQRGHIDEIDKFYKEIKLLESRLSEILDKLEKICNKMNIED